MARGKSGVTRSSNPWVIEQVRAYLKKDPAHRPSVKEWLKGKKMTRMVFERIHGRVDLEDKLHELELPNIKSIMERLGEAVNGGDPIEDQTVILDDAMFREGRGGSKTAAELWYRRKGLLEPEPAKDGNVNVAAIALRISIDGNGVAGKGVVEVSGGTQGFLGEGDSVGVRVLRPEVRKDSGQGETGDDSAGTVAPHTPPPSTPAD